MTAAIRFTVAGHPQPQGSKRAFVQHGRARIVDANQKPLRTWRQDVVTAALAATQDQRATNGWQPLEGPVRLDVTFCLPRPKYHYGTRNGLAYLKPTAPVWCDKTPDIDKLVRALADALTDAGLYRDDNQITDLAARMVYAGGRHAPLQHPGAVIILAPAGPGPGVRHREFTGEPTLI